MTFCSSSVDSGHLTQESHKLRTLFLTNAENGSSIIGGLRFARSWGAAIDGSSVGENELMAAGI